MDDNLPYLSDFLAIFALILLNGFFAAAEFAVIVSNPSKLAESGKGKGRRVRVAQWLMDRLDVTLPTTQVGTTVATLLVGWLGVRTFYRLLGAAEPFQDQLGPNARYVVSIAAALALIALMHVVIGELVAKSLALRYPEATLKLVAVPLALLTQVGRPVIFIATSFANVILGLFRTSVPATFERLHSVADLSLLVSRSTEGGMIDEDEKRMLHGVFGLSDTVAREVMTPRPDLVTIRLKDSLAEVVRTVVETGLSRFPVLGEGIDDVKGIVLAKDLLPYFSCTEEKERSFSVSKTMREPYFIPGTKRIDDLLNEFKQRKLHMAIVLDEHGGVDGVVTLEDLIEEIVGEIFDESDVPELSIVLEEGGDALVDGGVLVTDLNERLGLDIPEGDYDTIAGFIFTSLGRMPQIGDELVLGAGGAILDKPADAIPAEPQQSATANGNHAPTNGDASEHDSSEAPTAAIVVENVESHRIELVRVRLMDQPENLETPPPSETSQPKADSA